MMCKYMLPVELIRKF